MAFTEKYVTVTGGGLHDGSSEANAWTFDEAVANAVAGDRVNVKVGNHTCTSSSTVSGSGSAPIVVRGYKTTIGDRDDLQLGTLAAGTDIPKVTNTTGNYRGFTGSFVRYNHLSFHNSQNYQHGWSLGANSFARSCRFIGEGTGTYNALALSHGSSLLDCYLEHASQFSDCLNPLGNGDVNIIGCVFVNNGSTRGAAYAGNFESCIFKGWNLFAIRWQYQKGRMISNCSFIDCDLAIDGDYSYPYVVAIKGCYFDNCGTAIKTTNPSTNVANLLIDSCCYRNVTTELDGPDFQTNRKTDTSDSFVDSNASNYTLKSSSAGYAATNPTALPEFGTFNARDIGAIQHANPSLGVVLNAKHPIG